MMPANSHPSTSRKSQPQARVKPNDCGLKPDNARPNRNTTQRTIPKQYKYGSQTSRLCCVHNIQDHGLL